MLLLYNLILFLYTLARRRRPRERTPSVQRLSPLWVGPMSPYPRRRRPLRGHLLLSVKTACPTMGRRPFIVLQRDIFSDEGWTTYRDESRPYPLAAPPQDEAFCGSPDRSARAVVLQYTLLVWWFLFWKGVSFHLVRFPGYLYFYLWHWTIRRSPTMNTSTLKPGIYRKKQLPHDTSTKVCVLVDFWRLASFVSATFAAASSRCCFS